MDLSRSLSTSLASAPAPAPAAQLGRSAVSQASVRTYDIFTCPPVLTFTTESNAGGSGATVTQYIFNNADFTAAVTTNGSGAASIVNTYGDGQAGKGYAQLFRSWNAGRGPMIKGFTIVATNYTSGAQTSTPFNTLAFTIRNASLMNDYFNVPINVSAAVNNQQQQVGILTIKQAWYHNCLAQLSVSLPANTIFAFTFFTETSDML